ncbi:MAG: M23 family metallopeptidase, partial [Defluviitaleaceae bacterium]|nr:M23 family metallopeptidase [Defluviitaleaceae bacterium]
PAGTRINAAADGIVRLAGWSGGYGLTVIIDHGNGYSTLYAHNSRNRVTQGERVTRGQHIADVGTTGMSTGNHLHFEIRRNGVAIDPLPFFR